MKVYLFGVLLQRRLEEVDALLDICAGVWLRVREQNMICFLEFGAQSILKRHHDPVRELPDPDFCLCPLPLLIRNRDLAFLESLELFV